MHQNITYTIVIFVAFEHNIHDCEYSLHPNITYTIVIFVASKHNIHDCEYSLHQNITYTIVILVASEQALTKYIFVQYPGTPCSELFNGNRSTNERVYLAVYNKIVLLS